MDTQCPQKASSFNYILAAAIADGVNQIITFNINDFPEDFLTNYEIEVLHPELTFSVSMLRELQSEI